MNDSNLKPICTVGDLIEFLQRFGKDQAILKSDMLGKGYNRFKPDVNVNWTVRVNDDPQLDADFVDYDKSYDGGRYEVMLAIIL